MSDRSTSTPTIDRRTLTKGAVWATPAIVAGAPAALAATSAIPPDGLNGWVDLIHNCQFGQINFSVDGRGTFTGGGTNDRGIWVFVNDPNATITGATIIFYFNRSDFTFTNGSQSGWSNLARSTADDASRPATGYYAYKATYDGTWTWRSAYKAWEASSDPYWYDTSISSCNNTISAYARRSVVTNGKTVEFVRGPVSV